MKKRHTIMEDVKDVIHLDTNPVFNFFTTRDMVSVDITSRG